MESAAKGKPRARVGERRTGRTCHSEGRCADRSSEGRAQHLDPSRECDSHACVHCARLLVWPQWVRENGYELVEVRVSECAADGADGMHPAQLIRAHSVAPAVLVCVPRIVITSICVCLTL